MPTTLPVFPSWVFVVVSLQLGDDVLRAALLEAEAQDYVSVFKHVGDKDDDTYRAQSRYKGSSTAVKVITSHLTEGAKCLEPKWLSTVLSFLRSLPGGDTQDPHQGCTIDDIARIKARHPATILVSVIIALQEGM